MKGLKDQFLNINYAEMEPLVLKMPLILGIESTRNLLRHGIKKIKLFRRQFFLAFVIAAKNSKEIRSLLKWKRESRS